jgi:hypothetical protein
MMLDSTWFHERKIAKAASAWICTFKWTHALTFSYPVPNMSPVSRKSACGRVAAQAAPSNLIPPLLTSSTEKILRHDLRLMWAFVDGDLFGSRFHKKPLLKRSNFFGFPSVSSGDMLHVHMIWNVQEDRWTAFEDMFRDGAPESPFTQLVASGTHKLDRLHEIDGWVNYCSKQCLWRNCIISQELVPEK